MIDNNHQNEENSLEIAKKHVQISIKVKEIINHLCSQYNVYLATHGHRPIYKNVELESGEKFWSLQLRSNTDNKELKRPDVIITDSEFVKYFIEVKWGAIPNCKFSKSDIKEIVKGSEKNKMKKARENGGVLKCNGPAIVNGQHYYSKKFLHRKKFIVNDETSFLVVSYFKIIKDIFTEKEYGNILLQLKRQSDIFVLADIHEHVDDIPSLQEIIQLDC